MNSFQLSVEMMSVREICCACCVPYTSDYLVKKNICLAEKDMMATNLHPDLCYIPAGLTVEMLFSFLEKEGLRLHYQLGTELWRANTQREQKPTEEGILCCDADQIMRPTDLSGAPFNIESYDGFKDWAKLRGGVIPTVEQTLYLMARSIHNTRKPLWGCGSVACSNATDDSKTGVYIINYYPHYGLSLIPWGKIGQRWGMGTIPLHFRKAEGG